MKQVPTMVAGVEVRPLRKPMEYRGERWLTLVPEADDDFRIWEFGLTSGRLIQTSDGSEYEAE